LAIPKSWEGGELSSNNNSTDSCVNLVKQNATNIWRSTKSVYLYLLNNKNGQVKHQIRWVNDLGINNSIINWKLIYRNNYFCTLKTKLRSFRLKLNLRAITTNVHLHGFGIIDSNMCTFCSSYA